MKFTLYESYDKEQIIALSRNGPPINIYYDSTFVEYDSSVLCFITLMNEPEESHIIYPHLINWFAPLPKTSDPYLYRNWIPQPINARHSKKYLIFACLETNTTYLFLGEGYIGGIGGYGYRIQFILYTRLPQTPWLLLGGAPLPEKFFNLIAKLEKQTLTLLERYGATEDARPLMVWAGFLAGIYENSIISGPEFGALITQLPLVARQPTIDIFSGIEDPDDPINE